MSINVDIKKLAIKLRKEGKSYAEILSEIAVAKSTLSVWLREVRLSTRQKQRLSEKKRISALKGAQAMHKKRINNTENIMREAKKDIGRISKRELLLIGTCLYWAEGSKQKPHNLSTGVSFSNSDPQMLSLFLDWLRMLNISPDDILFSIYLHDSARARRREITQYWSKTLKLSINKLEKIYYKRDKVKTFRKNTGAEYFGQIRINVRKSTELNRRISGWIQGICQC